VAEAEDIKALTEASNEKFRESVARSKERLLA
jgi:hypothetical protein